MDDVADDDEPKTSGTRELAQHVDLVLRSVNQGDPAGALSRVTAKRFTECLIDDGFRDMTSAGSQDIYLVRWRLAP